MSEDDDSLGNGEDVHEVDRIADAHELPVDALHRAGVAATRG